MKQLLPKLTTKILIHAEQALLDIICLHEMGMTSAEMGRLHQPFTPPTVGQVTAPPSPRPKIWI